MQCAAKSKQTGRQCKKQAVPGKRVCRIHGGATPVGIASHAFRHGRYSKYLPTNMLPRYRQAYDDPNLLALNEEIALVDARLADLLVRVDQGESGALWLELRSAHHDLLQARHDTAKLAAALERIGNLIQRGATDTSFSKEIGEQIEQRRRLVESERRRLVELQQYMSYEQALGMAQALLEAIRTHVEDRKVLSAISTEFARILGRTDLAESAEESEDQSSHDVSTS
jgi:hypothetical protein